jgi:hypothetical protein
MKSLISLIFCVTLFFGVLTSNLQAQVSVTGSIFAEVIATLSANETAQLNFGKFSPETEGGEVLVTPDDSRSSSGTVILGNGVHNAATFYITGENEATYSISLPYQPSTITNVLTNKTMVVRNWSSDPPIGTGTGILSKGSQVVKVGATLVVGNLNDNPVGVYTGSYTITFNYN